MALALATHMDWGKASGDITAAYITAEIDCPIRVRIPSIDGTGPPRTARLLRFLYGLKQAGSHSGITFEPDSSLSIL